MAPEQLEGREADARSDLFALGCVLYEMASGRPPFSGKSRASLIASILREEPRPLSEVQPVTPEALDLLVRSCLAKDPEERWQSAHDLAVALRGVEEQDGGVAVKGPRLSGRARAAAAVAGLLLLAAAITLGRLLAPSATPEAPPLIRFGVPPPPGLDFDWARTPGAGGQGGGNIQEALALSPDGSLLAFTATDDRGQRSIWLRALEDLAPRRLPGTDGGLSPFWSPDGRHLGFFAEGKLKRIEVAGGPPVTVCPVAEQFPSGSWGAEGTIVFGGVISRAISAVAENGGTPQPVPLDDELPKAWSVTWPRFLPEGKRFLYLARREGNAPPYLAVSDLQGKGRVLVENSTRGEFAAAGEGDAATGFLLFARDGVLFAQRFDPEAALLEGEPRQVAPEVWQHVLIGFAAFSAPHTGALALRPTAALTELVWLDRQGDITGTVGEPGPHAEVRLSPGGERYMVSTADPRLGTRDLWVAGLPDGALNRATFLVRDGGDAVSPTWSPDGREIVFGAAGHGHPPRLYRSILGSGVSEPLLEIGPLRIASDWSPDGRLVAFTAIRPGTIQDIFLLPMRPLGTPQPLVATPFQESEGRFSPDGRRLAFTSDESGRPEVYVIAVSPPGDRRRVSLAGGSRPRWRGDGKELFYVSGDRQLVAVPIGPDGAPMTSNAQPLFSTVERGVFDYDVTADGERFLALRSLGSEQGGHIEIVLGWSRLLSRSP
jgi:Tol biopolymer transport system component